jgi:hypothetical protein
MPDYAPPASTQRCEARSGQPQGLALASLAERALNRPLFIPEGHDGIEARSLQGWPEAEKQADAGRHHETRHDGPEWDG